jgi:hypothetical protein
MASLQNRHPADNHEAREVYDSIKARGESSLESSTNDIYYVINIDHCLILP